MVGALSSEVFYVTIMSRLVCALLNSYDAMLRKTAFHSTNIIILSEAEHRGLISTVKMRLKSFQRSIS